MKLIKRTGIINCAVITAILNAMLTTGCNQSYRVTTDSMSNTFNTGQIIKVNKNAPISRNTIVFFNEFTPGVGKQTMLFRVAALSGDTVELKDGNLTINGKMIDLPENARLLYGITTSMPLDIDSFEENSVRMVTENRYLAYLTADEYNETSKLPNVSTIGRIISSPGNYSKDIVRNNTSDNWNEDQFGPLYIPAVGEKIKISRSNKELFADILPDLQPDSTVTVKEKLFFLLGDNRSNAADSRYIGLVTESNVLGTAVEEP